METPQSLVVSKAADAIPFLIKTVVVLGIGYYLYSRFEDRFIKLKENSGYPDANVTEAQARTRATSIANSIGWVSGDFANVRDNLARLNYNGFVRVYNAFGKQGGHLLSGDMNLIEWLNDQLDQDQLDQISLLLNGAFFRHSYLNLAAGETPIIYETQPYTLTP